MLKDQKIIELNGQQYDASTGTKVTAISGTRAKPSLSNAKPPIAHAQRGVSLDGVAAPKRRPAKATTATHVATQTPAKNARTTVDSLPKAVVIGAKPNHILRSKNILQSSLISKFGRTHAPLKTDIVAVKPTPSEHKPLTKQPPANSAKTQKKLADPTPTEPVDTALLHATSHTQPKHKGPNIVQRTARKLRISTRTLAMSSVALFVLFAGGIVAYSRIPHIAMQVAVQRTGIHASLPSYSPAGFSLKQPIDYKADQISLQYTSNTDKRAFRVIQKASAWDSQALLENFFADKHKQYQTTQIKGRTVYTYNNGDATWVDGGTWYQIVGNSALSSDQLIKIIDSL